MFPPGGLQGGDVTRVWGGYGQVVERAPKMNGMMVFMEHRFFGESVPFKAPFKDSPDVVGLLSVEQALADYAAIISAIRDEFKAWDAPVVTFGGSLAGSLAAWMRFKYPAIVDMALASSTPQLSYPGYTSQFAWRKQITDNFAQLAPTVDCPALVRKAFAGLASAGDLPRELHEAYRTCEDPSFPNIRDAIQSASWSHVEGLGEFAYPTKLSAINETCMRMAAYEGPPHSLFAAMLNTPEGSCLNLTDATAVSSNTHAWLYLACSEIVHPIAANNVTDMFPPFNWTLEGTEAQCRADYGYHRVQVRPRWIMHEMGTDHLPSLARATSRVVFVYGDLDPWHTAGILQAISPSLPVVRIADGTHCADMEASSSYDTATMKAGRDQAWGIIADWLKELQHQG